MRKSKWEQSYCVFDATPRLILNFKTSALSVMSKVGVALFTKCIPLSGKLRVLECAASLYTVRVKGGMSLRNGMWHSLRNDIIMRN